MRRPLLDWYFWVPIVVFVVTLTPPSITPNCSQSANGRSQCVSPSRLYQSRSHHLFVTLEQRSLDEGHDR